MLKLNNESTQPALRVHCVICTLALFVLPRVHENKRRQLPVFDAVMAEYQVRHRCQRHSALIQEIFLSSSI